jgi:hypothetical protein
MFEHALEKIEKKALSSIGDKLEITTDFNEETFTLTTVTYWDGIVVSEYEFDLTPMADAIEQRVLENLDD